MNWIFVYDTQIKRQSEEWHTQNLPRSKKALISKSEVKTIIILFVDSYGIVHKVFVSWADS